VVVRWEGLVFVVFIGAKSGSGGGSLLPSDLEGLHTLDIGMFEKDFKFPSTSIVANGKGILSQKVDECGYRGDRVDRNVAVGAFRSQRGKSSHTASDIA